MLGWSWINIKTLTVIVPNENELNEIQEKEYKRMIIRMYKVIKKLLWMNSKTSQAVELDKEYERKDFNKKIDMLEEKQNQNVWNQISVSH